MNMICTAPRWLPPSPSSYAAPTAKSPFPSPSRSPMFAMEYPKRSPLFNVGPFAVKSLISTVESTEPEPLSFMNIMFTAPF